MTVAAIILAAGRSTRFAGGHKLLIEIDGEPIVRRVAEALAASAVGEIVLVTPALDGPVAQAAGAGRWRTIENTQAAEGLSTSLRAGIEAIGESADGILVALADMPGIDAPLVDALIGAFKESDGRSIVFPVSAEGRQGHPVIWPRSLLPALSQLIGDTGGKALLAQHRDLWRPVATASSGAFADIDTREALASFRR